MFALVRRAWPYRDLKREDFDDIVDMLGDGVGEGAGRAPPLVHRDRINGVLRGRRGARMSAILNGGAIPEMADYNVVADPDDVKVGTVNEDLAIESMQGDIFLLGTHSWRIKRVGNGEVRVEDARGAPPTIPFWLGEAPGRTRELSAEVGALRRDVVESLGDETVVERLQQECGLSELAAVRSSTTCAPPATASASCLASRTWSSSASSTRRAACSSSCTPRSARASTAPGA